MSYPSPYPQQDLQEAYEETMQATETNSRQNLKQRTIALACAKTISPEAAHRVLSCTSNTIPEKAAVVHVWGQPCFVLYDGPESVFLRAYHPNGMLILNEGLERDVRRALHHQEVPA